MKILITGGAGFVGSSLAILLKKKYPSYLVTCLDNLKRRGSELNISRLRSYGVEFLHGDIRNKEDFEQAGAADLIVDASAEPSVLAGIGSAPDYVINTNLTGTVNCLNFALKTKAAFIFLSTSRIYPIETLNKISYKEGNTRFVLDASQTLPGISERGIAENFPIDGPRSFYGASKLASELFIQEYHEFFQLKTVVNRCGVIAGPWQMGKIDQGVMVLWMAKHYWNQSLSYLGFGGTGKQVRDVLHILDLFELIDFEIHHIDVVSGGTFNAGGGVEMSASLMELTEFCREITGNIIPIKSIAEGRQADIAVYLSDNSHVTRVTGWKPRITIKQTLLDIHSWIKENENNLAPILK